MCWDTITVCHQDGETYTLQYRDGELYLTGNSDSTEIVNESYTEEILEAATLVAVQDTVASDVSEVSGYLADMGLQPPQITVRVTYADGRVVNLQLGKQVPETTYYYYRWSGDNGVYMCDNGVYEAFGVYRAHAFTGGSAHACARAHRPTHAQCGRG